MRRLAFLCLVVCLLIVTGGARDRATSAASVAAPVAQTSGGSLDPKPAPAPPIPIIGPGFAISGATAADLAVELQSAVAPHDLPPTGGIDPRHSLRVRRPPPVRVLPLRI